MGTLGTAILESTDDVKVDMVGVGRFRGLGSNTDGWNGIAG